MDGLNMDNRGLKAIIDAGVELRERFDDFLIFSLIFSKERLDVLEYCSRHTVNHEV
jgi:hypothetical protein